MFYFLEEGFFSFHSIFGYIFIYNKSSFNEGTKQ